MTMTIVILCELPFLSVTCQYVFSENSLWYFLALEEDCGWSIEIHGLIVKTHLKLDLSYVLCVVMQLKSAQCRTDMISWKWRTWSPFKAVKLKMYLCLISSCFSKYLSVAMRLDMQALNPQCHRQWISSFNCFSEANSCSCAFNRKLLSDSVCKTTYIIWALKY